ncbi:MAG: metal-sulfur cluster assembly factor [Candidatus Ancillula trichonymphae]|jgi:metal-sulfur cluster biosynthetic enzyme|nr:metal-sulfur cluster assembly factor [Candidatus Ancillula trichonymphae]
MSNTSENEELRKAMLDALSGVIDPELGISIVDLGLVYGIDFNELGAATVNVTLTTPACPLTDTLEVQMLDAVAHLVEAVGINWVWTPTWSMDMITDAGREQLAAIGFSL